MPEVIARDHAPLRMLEAAAPYEKKFGDHFDFLVRFSKQTFDELHRFDHDKRELPLSVTIASSGDSSILADIDALKKVANSKKVSTAQRTNYYETLKSIYHKLPRRPEHIAELPDTFCVGIEREGRILAEALRCLPGGRSLAPHAKRIPYEGGLVVGLMNALPPTQRYTRCLIVDGAIASGATIMAIISQLRQTAPLFEIFSVHAPYEGLRGIVRFGEMLGVQVAITVGHATVGMNKKFYAVDSDGTSVIIGDIGDTISPLEEHNA